VADPGPTVVIGTAGHIDHGKTTLLRALTGIDADRLPEEQARGMTIDVGFAHLDLGDGTALDFVDVPGHDRLVGNMLVGAGEIDAVLLVVAADDGPRAQTLEHLELLDALGVRNAVLAITKADAVSAERLVEVRAAAQALLSGTSLAGATIVEVSSVTGAGLPELRHALVVLRDDVMGDLAGRQGRQGRPGRPGRPGHASAPPRLPIDRAFSVKGRGLVVTGTLRGGPVTPGMLLRVVPGDAEARVREVQVHHGRADRADGGRTALNLAGVAGDALRRGHVLTTAADVVTTDRLLVLLRAPVALRAEPKASWPPRTTASLRLHHWTATSDASIRGVRGRVVPLPDGRAVGILALAERIATMPGAVAVLRDPGSSRTIAAVTVLDPRPSRGVSRRRATDERLVALAAAPAEDRAASLLELHGAMVLGGRLALAPDVEAAVASAAEEVAVNGPTVAEHRAQLVRALRRLVTVDRSAEAAAGAAVGTIVDGLVASGRIVRDGQRLRAAGSVQAGATGERGAALARLVAALDADVPPTLSDAVREAGCAPDAAVQLERSGRIVRVEDDLAWATPRYLALRDRAVAMARQAPLAPAAFRDAIGGNRRIVMPLLEDLGRKGYLRRTPAGHLPGPRA
jgi:selenocysteine-specific elongation factor